VRAAGGNHSRRDVYQPPPRAIPPESRAVSQVAPD